MLNGRNSQGRRRLLRLPAPATVIAMIALLVALGGTAYGVKTVKHYPEFNGVDIIDHSLSGVDIKNASVGSGIFNSRARKALKGNLGPAGPQGPQGPQGIQGPGGPAGPAGLSRLIYRSSGALVNNAGQVQYGYAPCDSGYYAVGGGASTQSTGQYINASFPGSGSDGYSFSSTSWVAWVRNADSVDRTVYVFVICAPAASVGKTSVGGSAAKVGSSPRAMKPAAAGEK